MLLEPFQNIVQPVKHFGLAGIPQPEEVRATSFEPHLFDRTRRQLQHLGKLDRGKEYGKIAGIGAHTLGVTLCGRKYPFKCESAACYNLGTSHLNRI